jgi:restriction system protein
VLETLSFSEGKDFASEMTNESERARAELRSILHATIKVNDVVEWSKLKSVERYKRKPFDEPRPPQPKAIPLPTEPAIGFFDRLFGGAKKKLDQHAVAVEAVKQRRAHESTKFDIAIAARKEREAAWTAQEMENEAAFVKAQEIANRKIDELKQKWDTGDADAIIEHATLVLENSKLPDVIPKNFDLAYQPTTKMLLVDYQLPDPEDLPLTKTVRFIASTGELQETKIAQKDAKDLFDSTCYQLCLRTVHELFEADTHRYIATIVFNGFTDTVDKATGKNVVGVIMSLMTGREEFLALDLARVDPKACFKTLKGVAASSLAGLAPIAPIMEIDRSDRRFIDAKEIAVADDGATNLASMHWEDFEHLVRQLFEKEFASRGGEVKVTQASSDGGVDAIAFDPDPITGGKIVIQAKRYTKTVGVSAVRDLYGTVLSEGASKGILITTADFGPDAHKFAAGKPISLLSGANMLHLLQKHGTKAKIDLKAARKELGLS